MKKLSIVQSEELEHLKNWSLIIIRYMDEVSGPDSFAFKKFEDAILETYEKENLKGMKVILNDLRQWIKSLPKAHIDVVNQRLKAKFGRDLNTDDSAKKIRRIIERMGIKNLQEYRLIMDYFDEIYMDDTKKEEIEKVNSILEEYQKKTGKV